jgi:hypothetical protein
MEPQYAIFGKTAGWGRGQFGSDNTMPVDRNRKLHRGSVSSCHGSVFRCRRSRRSDIETRNQIRCRCCDRLESECGRPLPRQPEATGRNRASTGRLHQNGLGGVHDLRHGWRRLGPVTAHYAPQTSIIVRQNGQVKEAPRQTLIRRSDEPKFEIGDAVLIRDGVVGLVLARFIPAGGKRNEVHYIVQLKPDDMHERAP